MVTPYDFTWIVFSFIYGGLVLGLVALALSPLRLLVALQSYVVMVLVRVLAMYITPLEPPPGLIPLIDPVAQYVGSGVVLTRDLFFSGHTATLALLAFAVADRSIKVFFSVCAAVVGVLLLWQHVHYTVDILCAPFFALGCYHVTLVAQQRFGLSGVAR
jgi:hypothetical protein